MVSGKNLVNTSGLGAVYSALWVLIENRFIDLRDSVRWRRVFYNEQLHNVCRLTKLQADVAKGRFARGNCVQ